MPWRHVSSPLAKPLKIAGWRNGVGPGLTGAAGSLALPIWLCPAFAAGATSKPIRRRLFCQYRPFSSSTWCAQSPATDPALETAVTAGSSSTAGAAAESALRSTGIAKTKHSTGHNGRKLPDQCWGCGALAQTVDPEQAGFFGLNRKAVLAYLGLLTSREEGRKRGRPEDEVVRRILEEVDHEALAKQGVNLEGLTQSYDTVGTPNTPSPTPPPLCDRCHNLVHYCHGRPIYHPSLESLREVMEQSPFKYNHVYHVLDAADFPMSLLPKIHQVLDSMPLRSRNRRAKSGRFYRGRKTEISFIISRADLLAPVKEQVDRLMPYLTETLRDALGRAGRDVRLGNVWCVSAKRAWWTKELKEDVFRRGGAGWMVGKANVGKSRLFESVFPKGRMTSEPSPKSAANGSVPMFGQATTAAVEEGEVEAETEAEMEAETVAIAEEDFLSAENADAGPSHEAVPTESLALPPARPETNYPEMPVVSSLPGTTAFPIRVPYGGGKGELIDLPGLARSDLEAFVQPEHRASLLMKSRITPTQQVLKPGQSLLLGGFIRITPRTPDLIFMAYAFTPIKAHLTSTEKATAIQAQSGGPNVENIATDETGETISSAGLFELRWDVTKARTGPITRRDAVGIKVDRLPYRVVAVDILIEGCGWVEIVAQVRTKHLFESPVDRSPPSSDIAREIALPTEGPVDDSQSTVSDDIDKPKWPMIEVFSPEGRFIASRRPMNAWLLNKPRKTTQSRPRRSMKGEKKRAKLAIRAQSSSGVTTESRPERLG